MRGGDEPELRRLTEHATLDRALRLAHSIYLFRERDRATALGIVWEAVRSVRVRLRAQSEADRHGPRTPTKVRWDTLQWLQVLIYLKSEAHERRQEIDDAASLTQRDMIVRYVKHLILATGQRNSFHIALGLTRLLYGYTTAEAMSIYDLIFQDPDVSTKKADAYYRGRKNRLIEELAARFGKMLRIDEDARGGKRFRAQPDSLPFVDLIVEYLSRFTPWGVSCALPAKLDTWTSVHSLKGSQQSQIHTLIHPACFSRIVAALKLDPPEKRLRLPLFFLPNESGETAPKEGAPSPLTEEEADSIRGRLEEEERRRRKFAPEILRILADGRERARMDSTRPGGVRFELPDDAALIEVFGVRGEEELLLATHVLTQDDEHSASEPEEYSLVLEGGRRITLLVSTPDRAEGGTLSIEVRYEAVAATERGSLRRRLFGGWLAGETDGSGRTRNPLLSPMAAAALAALFIVALLLYFGSRSRRPAPEEIAQRQPHPSPVVIPTAAPTRPTTTNVNSEATPTASPTPARQQSGANAPARQGTTRSEGERAVRSLLDVERLYVGVAGDDSYSRALRQELAQRLRALNRFEIAESRDDADAALLGSARSDGKTKDDASGREAETGSATLEIVNVYGETIWRAERIKGTPGEVASRFADELLSAIENEKRRERK
jgi:hypothetical protein